MDQLERDFQAKLIRKIQFMFPTCVVMKTDPSYIQGFPDLIILYKNKWAALECKRSATAKHRPNQDDWIYQLYNMSYANFIYPENQDAILDVLDKFFNEGD